MTDTPHTPHTTHTHNTNPATIKAAVNGFLADHYLRLSPEARDALAVVDIRVDPSSPRTPLVWPDPPALAAAIGIDQVDFLRGLFELESACFINLRSDGRRGLVVTPIITNRHIDTDDSAVDAAPMQQPATRVRATGVYGNPSIMPEPIDN